MHHDCTGIGSHHMCKINTAENAGVLGIGQCPYKRKTPCLTAGKGGVSMQFDIIELLCDGDFPGRQSVLNLTLEDLEHLAAEKEKAAATNSDHFRAYQ